MSGKDEGQGCCKAGPFCSYMRDKVYVELVLLHVDVEVASVYLSQVSLAPPYLPLAASLAAALISIQSLV